MKLKNQLLALSALTLLLPWSGWKLLQELEHFLREAQENSMLASARSLAGALPLEFQSRLLFDVNDRTPLHQLPGAVQADGIQLLSRNPRGLFSYNIRPEAPGPLQLHSEAEGGGQVEGFWLDGDSSYRVELSLPAAAQNSDISFAVRDVRRQAPGLVTRVAGPLDDGLQRQWIILSEKR